MVEDTQPWEKYNSKDEYNCIVNDIADAIKHRRLVFFIGAGIPRIQGYANWNGYIDKLLNYWEEKISEEKKNDPKQNTYINSIDKIKESNMDKRRKVDFLNQILKNVYDEDDYKKKRLDFEKEYFQNNKIVKPNLVLENLSEMNALYFTTNYDNEIEKHLNKMRSVVTKVRDMDKLSNQIDKGNVTLFTVVHLHGTPDSDFENFISSSISYKNHYYIDNESLTAIRKWINEKNLLMVFLGSSMEEEEVLSLLPDKENKTKHIAFMDSGNVYSDVDKYILEMKEKFFEENNNTRIFWYGDKYTCLPPFIRDLRNRVQSILGIKDDNFYKFRRHSTKPKDIIKIFQNTSANKLDGYLQGLSDDLFCDRSAAFLNSGLLDSKSKDFPLSIWGILLSQLKNLHIDDLKKIIIYQIYDDVAILYKRSELFLKRYIKIKKLSYQQKDNYYQKFANKRSIEDTDFMKIPEIAGWYLINSVTDDNIQNLWIPTHINVFNLTLNAKNKLLEFLKSQEKNPNYILFSPDEDVQNNPLAYVMINDYLKVNNKNWEDGFDDNFYKNQFFIKILMVVYKKRRALPSNVVNKILKYVDDNGYIFGNTFNSFMKKYTNEPSKYFNKEPVSIGRTYITYKTIISKEDILSLNDDKMLCKLTSTKRYIQESLQKNSDEIKSIEGTIPFFKNILGNNNGILKTKLLGFLLRNVQKLFETFESLYLNILKHEYLDSHKYKKLCRNILNIYKKGNRENFNFTDYSIFKTLFDKENVSDRAIEAFLEMDVNKFSSNNIDTSKNLSINYFIGLDEIQYFILVDKILKINKSYSNQVFNKIESLENNCIKQVLLGKYADLYKDVKFQSYYNLIGLLLNQISYDGESYRLHVIKDNIHRFINVVKKLLYTGYIGSNVENTIDVILLNNINPNDLKKVVFEKIDYEGLFSMILKNTKFVYEKEWFIFLEKCYNNNFIKYLLDSFNYNKNKSKKLIDYASEMEPFIERLKSNDKVNISIRKTKISNDDEIQSSYINFLKVLLLNDRIDGYNSEIINEIVKSVLDKNEERKKVLSFIRDKYGEILYSQLLGKYYKI